MPNRHTHYGYTRRPPSLLSGPRPAKRIALESRGAERAKRVRGRRRS